LFCNSQVQRIAVTTYSEKTFLLKAWSMNNPPNALKFNQNQ